MLTSASSVSDTIIAMSLPKEHFINHPFELSKPFIETVEPLSLSLSKPLVEPVETAR
jgi:hypothetical protein